MAQGLTFQRSEKKYLLNAEQYRALHEVLDAHMQADVYGHYTVCNIYFDTDYNDLIRRSIEKPEYKEKLRLRAYGTVGAQDKVFLEIKKKFKGEVFKRRIKVPLCEIEAYLKDGTPPPSDHGQIFREIDYFLRFYRCYPKLFLSYDREALRGVDGEKGLRITFDTNIRSRTDRLNLTVPPDGERLLEDGVWLMEIKAPGAMPLWLTEALTRLDIYPTSFSKYGRIYATMHYCRQEAAKQKEDTVCSPVS